MDFSTFTTELITEMENLGYDKENLEVRTQKKNNSVEQHLMIKDDSPLAPSINLNPYFEEYKNGRTISDIANWIDEVVKTKPADIQLENTQLTWDTVKDHIFYTLVNGDRNEEFLNEAPHIRFLDFAIIFKIDVSEILNVPGTINIDDRLLEHLGVNPRELICTALENTPKIMPLSRMTFKEKMMQMYPFMRDECLEEQGFDDSIIIVTNAEASLGAAALLYSELVGISDNTWVIPSSIHECLLIPKQGMPNELENMEEMVKGVNNTAVLEKEFLSNKVYTYKEFKEAFRLAVDDELIDIG